MGGNGYSAEPGGRTKRIYGAGGARGEIARGSANVNDTGITETSRRLTSGIVVIAGDWVTTIDPATEQMGHMWGLARPEVRSAHVWNCAARKRIPRSNATNRSRCNLAGIEIRSIERKPDWLQGQAV